MLALYLPDKLTVLTAREAVESLRGAFIALEGVEPSPACLSLHTAQAMLEAARFRSCHNYCYTNAKASAAYVGYYTCYRCNEHLPDGWHWYVPEGELVGGYGTALKYAPLIVPDGHPQTRFRAFKSKEDGARDHMSLEKRKFPEAYTSARAGDVVGFVHGLKIRTFFTADEGPYLNGVSGLAREVLPLCIDVEAKHTEIVTDEEICQGMACVAPDPERALHNEAVVAMMLGQQGVDDWQREERNAAMREEADTDRAPPPSPEDDS